MSFKWTSKFFRDLEAQGKHDLLVMARELFLSSAFRFTSDLKQTKSNPSLASKVCTVYFHKSKNHPHIIHTIFVYYQSSKHIQTKLSQEKKQSVGGTFCVTALL